MPDWYPADYYIQPHYDSTPTINFWDQEAFIKRRRKYWDAAWTRALQRWLPVGLDLSYHPGLVECPTPGVQVSVVDIPPGIGAWTQFNEPPACGFVQVDITTWNNAVTSRNIGPLTKVVTHEVGHVLGFGHGGDGVMTSPLGIGAERRGDRGGEGVLVILIHPRMVTMNELLTYDQVMAEVETFLGTSRGRYCFEGYGWTRWWAPRKALPRIRTAMVGMKVGHPWLEVQRQSDKDLRSVEKVSQEPP